MFCCLFTFWAVCWLLRYFYDFRTKYVVLSQCAKLWLASRTLFLLFFPEYLSINKGQTVKAVALDSRSDFVAWLSAIRLAKFGTDLSLAYHRNLNSRQYLQQQSTKPKSNVTKTSSSNIDFQKVKGKTKLTLKLNKSIKFKNVEKR